MKLPFPDVINGRGWAAVLLQTLFITCSAVAALSLGVSRVPPETMILLGLILIPLQVARLLLRGNGANRTVAVCSAWFAWITFILTIFLWNPGCGIVAALSVVTMAVASRRPPGVSWENRWKMLIVFWLVFLILIWLCAGYGFNFSPVFFSGLISILALLILVRQWFRLSPVLGQLVNTLILLLAGLPVASLIYQVQAGRDIRPEDYPNYASYDRAGGDPAKAARAFAYYEHCYEILRDKIYEANPEGHPPFRPRPNSRGIFGQCPIAINNLGFRGRDIPLEKGDAYRIVALGESTTFGMTLRADDPPWPERLEQLIRERLKTRRRVEVINAGIPSYTLDGNLRRFPHFILPPKPDMIISYHGANCFFQIDMSLLRPEGMAPPLYQERPLKLTADFEQRVKLIQFRNEVVRLNLTEVASTNPMQTELADDYRKLIRIAATNHIRLMLANYSMAVNDRSGPGLVDFYQAATPDSLPGRIKANKVQSQMLEQLGRDFPEVHLIDTHPHLDGEHEKFIDYMHFSSDGNRQIAENIFDGIRKTLETDLGQ